jgi:hypothetical protein
MGIAEFKLDCCFAIYVFQSEIRNLKSEIILAPPLYYSSRVSKGGKTCSGYLKARSSHRAVGPMGRRLRLDSLLAIDVAEMMDGLRGEKEEITYG